MVNNQNINQWINYLYNLKDNSIASKFENILWNIIKDCFHIITNTKNQTLNLIKFELNNQLLNRFSEFKDIFNTENYSITSINFNIIISNIYQYLLKLIYEFIYNIIETKINLDNNK
jgi:hypothetical protein